MKLLHACWIALSVAAPAVAWSADLPAGASHRGADRSRAALLTPPDWTVSGLQVDHNFGYAVASADVNGDGFDDALVSEPVYSGIVTLYLGSSGGLATTPAWQAIGTQESLGESLSSAGDVNGDGFDDVIVGAPTYSSGQGSWGRAYLYLGSATGLSATPAWVVAGSEAAGWFGHAVAGVGDVNGDGFDDVIVGAYGQSGGAGAVYGYYGSPAGLPASPSWIGAGQAVPGLFGYALARAGDVNGDGFDDVIVGAFRETNDQNEEGRAYVFLGSASGLATTSAWQVEGDQAMARLGAVVAGVGDVNGDGYDDVAVTAATRVTVYHGSAAGPAPTPSFTALDDGSWESFGGSLSAAGDFNGDGVADLAIGAPSNAGGPGGFLLHFGSPIGLSPVANWAEHAPGDGGVGVSTASGDFDGDGFSDLLLGDPWRVEVLGRALAYYGWRVAKGDLDGDLKADLLLRQQTSGALDLWHMDGVTRTLLESVSPAPTSLDWQVAAVDDFDGDRKNDLVLANTQTGAVEFWRMDGATRLGSAVPLAAPVPPGWRIAGSADCDHDRAPDLVLTNAVTGDMVVWRIVAMAKVGEIVPSPARPVHSNWELVATQDFDGDFNPDLLWYNVTSGRTVLWLMGGDLVRLWSGFTNPMGPVDNRWRAVAAGDFGAGPGGVAHTADIVWRNALSGRLVVWYLDRAGNRTAGTFTTPAEPSPDPTSWSVSGPR